MYLGLDLGTSAVKAVLLGADGRVAAQAQAPLTVSRPRAGWSEQESEDWWRAAVLAIHGLPASLRQRVAAVGLAGQMHGAVPLDEQHAVLRPAILWNDGRAIAECAELEALVPDSRTITGNIAMPGFTAPKLLWLRHHEPALFARIAHVLLPKDYLRLRLTGDLASDMSDSAGTLWLDPAARAWSPTMLAACGLSVAQMPRLFEGNAATGTVRASVASELGIPVVPVAAGGGDNAAGAVGVGATEPGDGFLSLGTSGVLFVVSDGFAPLPARGVHAFCHALPDRWHQMAVMLSAASALDWAMRLTGFSDTAAALAAAEAASDADLPIFLPYLSGERTPHNDPHARGVLFGLSHENTPGAVIRAVLEGVAFGLADGADALRAAGTRIDALTVIGGGARSRLWGDILAAALGCRLGYRAEADIGPALGAARLAQAASGAVTTFPPPPLIATIEPDPALAERLRGRRARFAALYPALRPHFDRPPSPLRETTP